MRQLRLALLLTAVLSGFHRLAGTTAADWIVDSTYAPVLEGNAPITAPLLTAAPDGKVFVTTAFAVNGVLTHDVPCRLNTDGSIDTTFHPPTDASLRIVCVFSDGSLLMKTWSGTGNMWTTRRYQSDGSVDPGYHAFTDNDRDLSYSSPSATAFPFPDGRVLLKNVGPVNGATPTEFTIINADGTVANRFPSDFVGSVAGVLVLPDGRILVSASAPRVDYTFTPNLVRFNADGTLDSTFTAAAGLPAGELYFGPNGTFIVAGPEGPPVRVTSTGAVDPSFVPQVVGKPWYYGPQQASGKILYYTNNGSGQLRQLNVDGTDDGTVAVTVTGQYYDSFEVVTGPSGSAYVNVPILADRNSAADVVTRITAAGAVDNTYTPRVAAPATVYCAGYLPDGSLMLDGYFGYANNVPMHGLKLLRLNPDGTLNRHWTNPAQPNPGVHGFAQQPSGKIVEWGEMAPGQAAVRFNADGSPDATFYANGTGNTANYFAMDSTGAMYVMSFAAPTKIVRYGVDGAVDSTFQSAATGIIGGIWAGPDGSIVALQDNSGGKYFNQTSAAYVRLRHDGSIDPTFNIPTTSFGATPDQSTSILSDGSLVISARISTTDTFTRVLPDATVQPVATIPVSGHDALLHGETAASILYDLLQPTKSPFVIGLGGVSGDDSSFLWIAADGRMRFVPDESPLASAYRLPQAPAAIASPVIRSGSDQNPVAAGAIETLAVDLGATANVQYQWFKDGNALSGATSATYVIPHVTAADAGTYRCVVSTLGGSDYWEDTLRVNPSAHLVNLSTRVLAGGAARTPTCGFVTGGTQSLPVLIRGVGPALGGFGVAGAMAQPMILLHRPDGTATPFSGWPTDRSADMTAIGAFALPQGSKDAATFVTLQQGQYTADISDATGAGGIVLLEVYDASGGNAGDAQLVNASTRGFVGTDDKAMVTGFVVSGAGTVRVLIRAIGPGLTQFGVGDAIADPQITVFQNQTQIAANDNWGTRSDGIAPDTIQSVSAAAGAFPIDAGSKDAVVLRDFSAGSYTAQVSGVGGITGTAIVELYVVR